jgi:hypothetical protein
MPACRALCPRAVVAPIRFSISLQVLALSKEDLGKDIRKGYPYRFFP